MSILDIQDLHFSVGDQRILNGIDFAVQAGERVGIIGPNGSGKTTLFNCISGFCLPKKGSIQLREHDITELSPYKRARLGLGRVFQNFGVFREMSLLENMITAMESRNRTRVFSSQRAYREHKQLALEYLEQFGLAERANDKASSLSGGQMRLLEIIRTIAFGAEVFLLDEPTAGVSPKMKQDVEQLLRMLREMNKTVLVIEHDINFIHKLCDRVVVLDVGQIVIDGTPEEVRTDQRLHEIYFGTGAADAAG